MSKTVELEDALDEVMTDEEMRKLVTVPEDAYQEMERKRQARLSNKNENRTIQEGE